MLNILRSKTNAYSTTFTESKRQSGEDNIEWLQRNLPAEGGVHIVLLGGKDRISFRLRAAQSQLRDDVSPSNWSHVALLNGGNGGELAKAKLTEISLDPRRGFGLPTPTNGVQEGVLGAYKSRGDFPNIAVMTVPVAPTEVTNAIERFQGQRAVLDATELVVVWLAYVWGAGRTPNPLLESRGIPSAAMLEAVMGAAGYDLTPGLESRASCPEAIWQAAKWWHEYYAGRNVAPPAGSWTVNHRL